MMVLITYDVCTDTAEGKKRLRLVARQCVNYGQRVQHSVFECLVDPVQLAQLRERLEKTIDPKKDSLRYYNLGDNWRRRVEHVGAKPAYDPEGPIMV
ncbi:MAG: CRISPR-associated endonuclease Cas2 [Bacillota bacterium]|nr:CRISPR-associated endonuclease Cas2 [Bacillota bacterium]